jgi:thymidylate synthase (FAD)
MIGIKVKTDDKYAYVTMNYRHIVENNWLDDLQYICEPTEDHYLRLCMKFNTSIGVSREGNRHRTFSIAEQSTRYCNYSKAKFGEEITFVEPAWDMEFLDRDTFISHLSDAESHYMALIDLGWQPQQAREVLPLCTATEVVYTAFVDDWRHFFDLRLRGTTGAPQPNMKEVAELAHKEIREKLGLDL